MTRSFLLVSVAVTATCCCTAPALLLPAVLCRVLLTSTAVTQLRTSGLSTRSLRLRRHEQLKKSMARRYGVGPGHVPCEHGNVCGQV